MAYLGIRTSAVSDAMDRRWSMRPGASARSAVGVPINTGWVDRAGDEEEFRPAEPLAALSTEWHPTVCSTTVRETRLTIRMYITA